MSGFRKVLNTKPKSREFAFQTAPPTVVLALLHGFNRVDANSCFSSFSFRFIENRSWKDELHDVEFFFLQTELSLSDLFLLKIILAQILNSELIFERFKIHCSNLRHSPTRLSNGLNWDESCWKLASWRHKYVTKVGPTEDSISWIPNALLLHRRRTQNPPSPWVGPLAGQPEKHSPWR